MTRLFTLPYDCGQRNVRMGAGPVHLAQRLGMDTEEITPSSPFPQEIKTSFELYRALASHIAASDEFPIVLSGHCGASIGAMAGLGADAILWFDAHGDYNTPEATETGYLDGMCLAVATGRCWHTLARTIPGFTPIDPHRVIHVGGRDWSPGEREALLRDGVKCGWGQTPITLNARRMLVHVDVDVIDAKYGRANQYACEGGLSPDDVLRIIEDARAQFTIVGLVIASYDPSCDSDGRIGEAAARIVRTFC